MKYPTSFLFSFLSFFLLSTSIFSQSFQVIPVPYRAEDPSIPHPAYSGARTVLKAVARSSDISDMFYYRWDADGDGTWDQIGGKTPVAGDTWYRSQGTELDGWFIYPEQPGGWPSKTVYNATIQVCTALSGTDPVDPVYSTYRQVCYSGMPDIENIDGASDEQLEIMRSVAADNALWYLHKQMTRSGTGTVDITGYIEGSDIMHRMGNTALFSIALLNDYHSPAYPPGTYHVYNNQPPAGFLDMNDASYFNDPYAEDLIRALNYILLNINQISVDAASEADDCEPINGTNDQLGYYIYTNGNNETGWHAFSVAALALSGLMGSEVQVNNLIKGQSWEFVIQQLVDYIVFLQRKTGSEAGGWFYNTGGTSSISYLTGEWAAALEVIENECSEYNVCVNDLTVKTNLVNALKRYQNTDGGALYSYASSPGSLFEATATLLNACRWLGWDSFSESDNTPIGPLGYQITKAEARGIYDDYYNFMATNWQRSGGSTYYDPDRALWSDGNYNPSTPTNNLWNFSLFFTALSALEKTNPALDAYGSYNWRRQFVISLLKNQYDASDASGPIPEGGGSLVSYYSPYGGTTLGVNTLLFSGSGNDVVAVAQASSYEINEGCAGGQAGKVVFYHDDSYTNDPEKQLMDYQWIFDSEGGGESEFNNIDINGIPASWYDIPYNTLIDGKWHTTIPGSFPEYTYMNSGEYTAGLRVLDNSPGEPGTDIGYITVNVLESINQAPVVSSGGPYTITEGDDLVLEGDASDSNETCGDIVTTSWDLDNDGLFDDFSAAGGTVPWATISGLGLPTGSANDITIRAVDKDGLEDTDNTTLTITVATKLDLTDETELIRIYPNPATGNLYIDITDAVSDNPGRIQIIDFAGRIIIERESNNLQSQHTFDVSSLKQGIYFIKISSEGLSKKLSFVKN